MPIPKTPVSGDVARLEQLGSGLKQAGGTHGPLVQRNDVGRPSTGGTPASPAPQISPEQQQVFKEMALAEMANQYWSQMASISPTPWVQAMRDIAQHNAQAAAAKVYNTTPNQSF